MYNEIDLKYQVIGKWLANVYLVKKSGTTTAKEIVKFISDNREKFEDKYNLKIDSNINEPRIRDIINWIRRESICKTGEIVSNSKGYWISNDKDEIVKYLQSWEDRLSIQYKALRSTQSRLSNYKSMSGIKSAVVKYDKKGIEGDLFDSL
jgi:hypothetical protein